MPTPTWKGSTAVQPQPGYPRFRRDARGIAVTMQYRGPYATLRTYGPAIGDDIVLGAFELEPDDEIVFCESVDCQPDGAGEAGPGTLTVVYSNVPNSGGLLVASTTTIEVDFAAVERPLLLHPRYCTGGAKALDTAARKKVETWEADKSAANYAALTAEGLDYAAKVLKGTTSYLVGAPIARKTTRSTTAPTVSSVGTRSATAPVSGAPSGYQWLKIADRAVRQAPASGWERVEEWQGAKEIDADLYTGVI